MSSYSIKKIGGFLDLELNKGREYHEDLTSFNCARNALSFILQKRGYKTIHIPYYICSSVVDKALALNIKIKYYNISKNFIPIVKDKIEHDEAFLCVNYFGLFANNIKNITSSFQNIIIDNSQAFFEKPLLGIDTIYSPRKFFGIADGGYLSTNIDIGSENIKQQISCDKMLHLLMRADDADNYYDLYKENEKFLSRSAILGMSLISKRILQNINYNRTISQRIKNFEFLDSFLNKLNKIKISSIKKNDAIPLTYPFLIEGGKGLRSFLISKNIFIPQYWENVLQNVKKYDFEYDLSQNLCCLPIDQRYYVKDMSYILNLIKEFLNNE
jgi:hypothetical protein